MRPSENIHSLKRALLALLIPGVHLLTGCGMSMTQSLSTYQLMALLSCATRGTCPRGAPCARSGGSCSTGACPWNIPPVPLAPQAPDRADLLPGGDDPLIDEETPEDPEQEYDDLTDGSEEQWVSFDRGVQYGTWRNSIGPAPDVGGWKDRFVVDQDAPVDVYEVGDRFNGYTFDDGGVATTGDQVGDVGEEPRDAAVTEEEPLPGLATWSNNFNLDLGDDETADGEQS
jgi:hypothetical protein